MSYDQQLDLVYTYLKRYIHYMNGIADVYLAVFYPYAIKQGQQYVIGSEKSKSFANAVYNQNPGFHNAQNKRLGVIRKSDITRYVLNRAKKFGYTKFSSIVNAIKKFFV